MASSTQSVRERSVELGLVAVLLAGAFAAGLTPIADGDLYWHLAAAREMVHTGKLLTHDPFSLSALGRPWADVHWLFQLAIYPLHALGGLRALVFAKSALVAAGTLVLFFALERNARALFVPLCLSSLFLARHWLLLRPVIASLVLLAYFFFALERFRREGRARALLGLPLAQVLWSNCQGLFALGPAMIAAYVLEAGAESVTTRLGARRGVAEPPPHPSADPRARVRALSLALAACALATFVTPYGSTLAALPLKLLARLAPHADNPFEAVAENVPPFVLERIAPGELWHFKWFLALLALALVLSAKRARSAHLVLVAGFAGLALIANRNVLLFYWIATPIVAALLAPVLGPRLERTRVSIEALASVLGAFALAASATAAARETSFREPAAFRFPIESAAHLARAHERGSIFSADQDGGYLIWTLYPRFKPYIDTRLVLRTPEQYREYLSLAENPERFDAFARQEGFAYITLPVGYPDRYLHLIAHLYQSREWTLIFTNGAETLFAQRGRVPDSACDLGDNATIDRILARISQQFSSSATLRTAARLQLASLAIGVGELAQADRVLARTAGNGALALRARARLAAGDLDRAREIGEQLMHEDDHDVRNLDLMAMIYVSRGELEPASKLLRRAIAIDPFDGEATSLLTTMEEHGHER